ncbi:MAG: hypothetical protein Q8Q40_01275 [Methylococcaceae bacterium]|nr:hypothetical protein [Methylococcaceae bacterium]MDP3902590.1 hypothetical protein [Methylococcaceae bacterium]
MSVTGNAGKESVREDGIHGAADERQTASFERFNQEELTIQIMFSRLLYAQLSR